MVYFLPQGLSDLDGERIGPHNEKMKKKNIIFEKASHPVGYEELGNN